MKTYFHEQRQESPLMVKSFNLAIRIVKLYKYLTTEKKEYVMSQQILKSGTNPGAMVREALNAESGSDFIHKLGIAQKEIAETQYWLELLHVSEYISESQFDSINLDLRGVFKFLCQG